MLAEDFEVDFDFDFEFELDRNKAGVDTAKHVERGGRCAGVGRDRGWGVFERLEGRGEEG